METDLNNLRDLFVNKFYVNEHNKYDNSSFSLVVDVSLLFAIDIPYLLSEENKYYNNILYNPIEIDLNNLMVIFDDIKQIYFKKFPYAQKQDYDKYWMKVLDEIKTYWDLPYEFYKISDEKNVGNYIYQAITFYDEEYQIYSDYPQEWIRYFLFPKDKSFEYFKQYSRKLYETIDYLINPKKDVEIVISNEDKPKSDWSARERFELFDKIGFLKIIQTQTEISEGKKHEIISKILNIHVDNIRKMYSGTYDKGKLNLDKITDLLEGVNVNKNK